MKENAVIRHEKDYEKNYAGFDPTSPESYIIFSLMQNIHQEKSLELAGAVQAEMVKATNHKDRGVRQAGYLVLKDATMPAILVESGFISNREDEKFLMSQAGQTKIATAIFKGIETYKRQVEKKSSVNRSGQPGSGIGWKSVRKGCRSTKNASCRIRKKRIVLCYSGGFCSFESQNSCKALYRREGGGNKFRRTLSLLCG